MTNSPLVSPASAAETASTAPPVANSMRTWLVLATFALGALCLYWPAQRGPFIFDDDRTVSLNDNIQHLWPADWLTKETRPVGALTFALNYQLHGLLLPGYHWTNVAIHAVGAWMLFLLLSLVLRLPGKDALSAAHAQAMALAVALIWLVHPLNTQAVSYIAQRYESQMGLFFLTTLYCLARGSQGIGKVKIGWYLAAIAAGWLGMGTKEVMCTILVVAPLFDRAFLADSWKSVFRQRGWVYAAIVPAFVGVLFIQRSVLVPGSEVTAQTTAGFAFLKVTPWEYFRTQPEIILHYVGIACFPKQLIFDYAWPVQNDLWKAGISGLILTVLFAGSVYLYVRRPRWGFPALSFFLILGPTSSFMPIADLAVEHRMYLPLISLCAAAVFWGNAWLQRLLSAPQSQQRFAFALALAVILSLSVRTHIRNEDYKQPLRLHAQSVRFNPANRRAHNNLALRLKECGMQDEARKEFRIAIQLEPTHPHAHFQLGLMAAEERQFTEALACFTEAYQLDPRDTTAGYCKGLSLMELGRDREAVEAFKSSLRVNPRFGVSQRELAWVLATTVDDDVRDGKHALEIANSLYAYTPRDPRLLEVLAAAYAETGDFGKATKFAEEALEAARRTGWPELRRAPMAKAIEGYQSNQPKRRVESAS